jgi:hypothetical protein
MDARPDEIALVLKASSILHVHLGPKHLAGGTTRSPKWTKPRISLSGKQAGFCATPSEFGGLQAGSGSNHSHALIGKEFQLERI